MAEGNQRRKRALRRAAVLLSHAPARPGRASSGAAATADSPARAATGAAAALDPDGLLRTQWAHAHLRWMTRKDALGQDVFLVGPTGPMRRWLALRWCEAQGREFEVVALTRDTTEGDLKQRRELAAGGTLVWKDQPVVEAALHGRVLILEGLEKVERNVLPVLNNLLENREMHLDDGRFLVAPQRYDTLARDGGAERLREMGLRRVSPAFRVVALGVPVPPFPGNPLDPPLRSRFQARRIDRMPAGVLLRCLSAPGDSPEAAGRLMELVGAHEAVWTLGEQEGRAAGGEARELAFERLVYPSEPMVARAARLLRTAPECPVGDAVRRMLPVRHLARDEEAQRLLEEVLPRLRLRPAPRLPGLSSAQSALHARGLESLRSGCDLLIVGPRGEGKSRLARALVAALQPEGRAWETLTLYRDMTSRDLLQRRETLPDGATVWRDSCVATAARLGRVVVLDGADRLVPGSLAVLSRLLEDRELALCDGTVLASPQRVAALCAARGVSRQELAERHGVAEVHPDFRVIALAAPPDQRNPWLTQELLHSFHFFCVEDHVADPEARRAARVEVLAAADPAAPQELISRLVALAGRVEDAARSSPQQGGAELSVRQLLRLLRRARRHSSSGGECAADTARRVACALLLPFMPHQERGAVLGAMAEWPGAAELSLQGGSRIQVEGDWLTIGTVRAPISIPRNPALVPDILFYDIPMHTRMLESLLEDFMLGEHLLLIGNQGVGKNKLADRLLQLLRREREYVQLHRDTTVQALTLLPSMRGGVVYWEDSPLVKAMTHGRVLVIDEFDKAPAEVVCVLKGLLQDGEVLLGDGRRFYDTRMSPLRPAHFTPAERGSLAPVHPDFRVIALANRPGFPFLGNDFFREMGDVFSAHTIENPDKESELSMLQRYAPHVPPQLLLRLVGAFGELRQRADEGVLSYPYSTRELVNVARHLDRFPDDSATEAVENVFAFDFDPDVRQQLYEVFQRHGVPVRGAGGASAGAEAAANAEDPAAPSSALAAPRALPAAAAVLRLQPAETRRWALQQRGATRWQRGRLQHAVERGEDSGRWLTWEDVRSCRLTRFGEEVYGWDCGAEPADVCALGRSVFVLVPGQELREYDTEGMRWRSHDLRLARLANGHHRCLAAMGEWVATYDEQDRALVLLNAAADPCREVEPFALDLFPGSAVPPGAVRVLALADAGCFLLHGVGGSVLSFFSPAEGRVCEASLPFAIAAALPAAPGELLVRRAGAEAELWAVRVPERLLAAAELQAVAVQSSTSAGASDAAAAAALRRLPSLVLGGGGGGAVLAADHCSSGGWIAGPAGAGTEIFAAPRPSLPPDWEELLSDPAGCPPYLRKRRTAAWLPAAGLRVAVTSSPLGVVVEVTDLRCTAVRAFALARIAGDALPFVAPPHLRGDAGFLRESGAAHCVAACALPDAGEGVLVLALSDGQCRLLELGEKALAKGYALWRRMFSGSPASQLPRNAPEGAEAVGGQKDKGSGGDSGMPGSGGSGGGGAGGSGGGCGDGGLSDFSEPALHSSGPSGGQAAPRPELSEEEMERLRKDGARVLAAARERAQRASSGGRERHGLQTELDEAQYQRVYSAVSKEIQQLRVVLGAAEARERERTWLRGQTHGELDDARIVDSAAGERNVWRRRGRADPLFGRQQRKPKRLRFVVDLSSSMARMNGDGRLDRLAAAVVMIMEAFAGHEARFSYDIVGHSGETDALDLVLKGKAPEGVRGRLEVVRSMYSHASHCMSGDNTLAATLRAIREVAQDEADDHFVFVVSDANLAQYGVHPTVFAKALQEDPRVNACAFFIANPEEAEEVRRACPPGRVFTVLDTRQIPIIFQRIFAAALLRDAANM
eukprot:TRINITY_DN1222_c0_g1_i1.p1 TRINITY_DN1222_c0_g1~~TRINITY_DN1222_c0_g1_i1.p1  ORF type:complete len:1879 (+),score=516.05 TRINITY_DN1222_c0_g1_i1:79-5637(+)